MLIHHTTLKHLTDLIKPYKKDSDFFRTHLTITPTQGYLWVTNGHFLVVYRAPKVSGDSLKEGSYILPYDVVAPFLTFKNNFKVFAHETTGKVTFQVANGSFFEALTPESSDTFPDLLKNVLSKYGNTDSWIPTTLTNYAERLFKGLIPKNVANETFSLFQSRRLSEEDTKRAPCFLIPTAADLDSACPLIITMPMQDFDNSKKEHIKAKAKNFFN